jgi:Rod binding domain-containing protein
MTMPVKTVAPVGGYTGFEKLRRPTNGTVEAEKTRLRQATKEFESYFIYQMLKTMRQTVPENALSQDTPMSGGMGKDTFTDLFDMEIARKTSFGGHNSIADLLYKSMEKLIEAKADKPEEAPLLQPLKPPPERPRELKSVRPIGLPEKKPAPLKISKPDHGLPIQVAGRPLAKDSIMAQYGSIIEEAARETGLDSTLIHSVIRAESNGDPEAVSRAGAKGLMQLVDSTARELRVRDAFDPKENIRAGSRYLRKMYDQFGDMKLALAAYNAGPGNVRKYGGVPPFAETQKYVQRVTDFATANRAK